MYAGSGGGRQGFGQVAALEQEIMRPLVGVKCVGRDIWGLSPEPASQ